VTWRLDGRRAHGTLSSRSLRTAAMVRRLRGAGGRCPCACRGGAAVTAKRPSGSSPGRSPAESQPSAGGPACLM